MNQAKHQYTWEESQFVDDVAYRAEDAQQFKALLQKPESDAGENALIAGSLLKGRIVEITKDFVVVDVGLKSEGLVPIAEFSNPDEISLGSEVEVLLDYPENEHGQIVLSREKAERLRQWEHIMENCEEGSIVKGRVLRKVKGGLIVDIGMEAFLPGSQIDNKRIKNLDEYVGKTYEFKILKINSDRKNVVVSRRELLEAERMSKKAELLEMIKPGDVREGVVKNITDFGVFLDLNGIDGLLHITGMAWKRVKHPSEMVQVGQKIEVVILSVDKDKGRVALGLKQKQPNPWEHVEEKYPPGTRVKGKIVNLVSYGAFMELEPGIEGLIHISEMSWTRNITDPSEILKVGDEVEAMVLAVHKEEGKISLGLKQLEHNPWDEVEREYPVGLNVKAEIRNLTNYGAFAILKPGVEGLIHISDLSWVKKVAHPSEVLRKGDIVDAIVLSVDKSNQKITLGIKQLAKNPWEDIEKILPVGSIVKGKVTKITAFGAFVKLENEMEALVHVTELSDKSFGKVEEVVSKGDEITAKVIKVDPEHKKIALSIKEHLIEKNQYSHDDIVVAPKKRTKRRKDEEEGSSEAGVEENTSEAKG